jgi:hypothetical protein
MRIALLSVLLAGCFGEVTDLGENTPDAKFVDVKGILRQWSGCMTMGNFQAANMTMAWSTLTTENNKSCMGCHNNGEFSFIATDDEGTFFSGLTQHSYFTSKYFTVDIETEKVVVNTGSFKNANTLVGHPRFNVTNNQGMAALNAFYDATVANTLCSTPTMVD